MSKNIIPKIIHYCWFGNNPLPDDVRKYIETWKEYCPDYEIIEWNDKNFDVNSNEYTKEAYLAKKWAFVSDYVRLCVLYNYGGIYLDTDMELIKNIDKYLVHEAFSGFETTGNIPTGLMACRKHFPLFKELLDDYNDRHFILPNGEYDMTTNVISITNICKKYGLVCDNTYQNIRGFILYPSDYFCAKDSVTGIIKQTDNTFAIHHFSGSWFSENKKKRINLSRKLNKKYGVFLGKIIYNTICIPYRLFLNISDIGIKKTLKKIVRLLKK